MMVDRTQLQLINALGRTRRPFAGLAAWPDLIGYMRRYSARLIANKGESEWSRLGGIRGQDGQPTFRLSKSSAAAHAVQKIANSTGGFHWTDERGMGWAVRLVPLEADEPHDYVGLAVNCPADESACDGTGPHLDAEQLTASAANKIAAARHRLAGIGRGLWLSERSEQALWAIHAAVLSQRSSRVQLADVVLGQMFWGGDRASWPDNWRADVFGS